MEPGSSNIENFMENYDRYNLMKEPTCYKSNPPKYYDSILTKKKYSYINTGTYETGLSVVAQTLNHHFVNITESLNIARPLSDNVQQTSDERTASSLLDQLKCFETTVVF